MEENLAELLDTFRCIFVGFWLVLPFDAKEVERNATENDKNVDAEIGGFVVGWNEDKCEADNEEYDGDDDVDFDGSRPVGSINETRFFFISSKKI